MINSEVEKIIAAARDKYTVHECGECTYRKCCDLGSNGFGSAECLSRRESISLMLGIEDGYFTKLLDGIEAAWKREKAEIEADALAVGGVVDAARHKPGNAAAMREALEEISSVSLGNLKEPIDGDSSNLYQDARYEGDRFVGVALPAWVAVDWYKKLKAVKEKAIAALAAPPRNCDVGTPDEQLARFNDYCNARVCISCGVPANLCRFWWAQTPYDEGGAK